MSPLEVAALKSLNKARRAWGLPSWPALVPATPSDPCGCEFWKGLVDGDPLVSVGADHIIAGRDAARVIYAAFGRLDDEGRRWEVLRGDLVKIRMRDTLASFVEAFDERRFPHLIDDEADEAYRVKRAAEQTLVSA